MATGSVSRTLEQIVFTDIWDYASAALDLAYSCDAADSVGSTHTDRTGNGFDGALLDVEDNSLRFLSFNGTTAILAVDGSFDPLNTSGAVAFWVRINQDFEQAEILNFQAPVPAVSGTQGSAFLRVVVNGATQSPASKLAIISSQDQVSGVNEAPPIIHGNGAIAAGAWVHLIAQSTGTGYEFYIDGVKQTTVVVQGADDGRWFGDLVRTYLGDPLVYATAIGRRDAGAKIDLDDVRIYNRNLTDAEALQISGVLVPRPGDFVPIQAITDYDHPDYVLALTMDVGDRLLADYDDVTGNEFNGTEIGTVADVVGVHNDAVQFQDLDAIAIDLSLLAEGVKLDTGAFVFNFKLPVAPTGIQHFFAINRLRAAPSDDELVFMHLPGQGIFIRQSVSGNVKQRESVTPLSINTFQHVVIQQQGDELEVYLDGVKETITSSFLPSDVGLWLTETIQPLDLGYDVTIGRRQRIAGNPFYSTDLIMDEVLLLNRPLTPAEIILLRDKTTPVVVRVGEAARSIQQRVFAIETSAISRTLQQTVSTLEEGAVSRTLQQSVFAVAAISRTLRQRVKAPTAAQDAVQWEAIVTVDGTTQTQLTGTVRVTGGENEQVLAVFQIRPAAGVIAVSDFTAKPVTIDYADQFQFARLFTGIIDEVEYDATENLLTFTCITNRKDLLNARTRGQLDIEIGGFWSEFVFDKDADSFEYANNRISTVFAAFETTPHNQFRLIPFKAKVTPDITYTEADILDDSIVPTFVSRDQLVNSWTLNFEYRYNRLRHRERSYAWDIFTRGTPQSDAYADWGKFLLNPTILLPRDAISLAIEQNQWTLKNDVTFTDLPAAGYFGGIGWTPKQTTLTVDDKGRQIRRVTDISKVYTTAAVFTLARRFAQQLTERYQVKMLAPQSVTQYGEIKEETNQGITVNFDVAAWEDFDKFQTPLGSQSANGDFVIDRDDNDLEGGRSSFDNAIQTAQAVIKRNVLDSHRQNYVELDVLLDPDVDLTKTVFVNTARVQARGKVFEFEHLLVIDDGNPAATTSVKLAISKAIGSQADDGISVPTAAATTDATFAAPTVRLSSYFGNHRASKPYDNIWSGWITNFQFQDVISATLNTYPVKFTVDGEKIGDHDRKERKIATPSTVNIEIPDELLTITAP